MRWALTIVAALLAFSVLAFGQGAGGGGGLTIYYFDPGAVTSAQPFETKVNALLTKIAPGTKLKAFGRVHELQGAIATSPPDFLLIPPYLKNEVAAGVKLDPILIRERDHSPFYEIVLVGPGRVEDLKGKVLAATGDATQEAFINEVLFKGFGVKFRDIRVQPVPKEIDGVLAAGSGQVAAACTSPGTVPLVKKVNPSYAANLNEMHKVSTIPLAALFVYGDTGQAKVNQVKQVFGGLHNNDDGKKILKLFKADKLAEVDASMKEKL